MITHQPKQRTPVPAVVATDVVLFTVLHGALHVRLIAVHRPPHYRGAIGLPGGLIFSTETAEQSASRNLKEKGGVTGPDYIEQLMTMSGLQRDPRSRVVSVGYLGIVSGQRAAGIPDSAGSWWCRADKLPALAFDHAEIVRLGLERLKSKITYSTLACCFLPPVFTLSELQEVYETILQAPLDKRNFRKKLLGLGVLAEVKGKTKTGKHRPAAYYKCKSKQLQFVGML